MAKQNKVSYNKLPKSFEDQVKLLKSRGLHFENEKKAEKILQFVSYNRLSNYWYPFLEEPKAEEIFKPNTSFDTIFSIYQFDSELRTLTFQAIEQIEIAVRTQIIYHLSHKHSSGFWYENSGVFKNYPQYVNFLSKITINTEESKQEFILKYRDKYQQFLPPSWKAFEIITFNSLLFILKNVADYKDIIPVAKSFGLNHEVFISWVETLVYIRNICAHHSRLWNIILTISPVWPKNTSKNWVDRWENIPSNTNTRDKVLKTYTVFCMITYLHSHINPYSNFKAQLKKLIEDFSEVDINYMGFPENWESQPLWK
jgi:abortive infection bacteriophage resistance protein